MAVVTLDRAQLDEENELVALALSRGSVVTWDHGDEDPVVLWGQLLAYMPQVLKVMRAVAPVVVILPNPRLQSRRNSVRPRQLLGEMKLKDGIDFPQRKRRAVASMRAELEVRRKTDLARFLVG